jgi:adenine-specific DNA-methyltransferase
MKTLSQPRFSKRYEVVTEEKAGGATYTPKILADFVAQQIVKAFQTRSKERPIRVLDPAIGDGELLISLLEQLGHGRDLKIEVHGFETSPKAMNLAMARLKQKFPSAPLFFEQKNFLEFVLEEFGAGRNGGLFQPAAPDSYDLIIANPPYVRTQIMGATQAQLLSEQFGLAGRVDLYYAFLFGMAKVLEPQGIAGIIVSNRFMTTKSGASVRLALTEQFNIRHVWDLGDTKLFDAAVLPAVILVEGKNGHKAAIPDFTSIYETTETGREFATDPIDALSKDGLVEIDDGRCFLVKHGALNTGGTLEGVWRIATETGDAWLDTVKAKTWGTFRNIGKIRVGVKTCADKVFIRSDWENLPEPEQPELLRPLTTHHIARRFKALTSAKPRQILYAHKVVHGQRRAADLSQYPKSKRYLEQHRAVLEHRYYVIEAGREWYELWVPQDPAAWEQPKLVFRDIAEKPTFWIDLEGSVVNGDCYWLISENGAQENLLWLAAAVANSTFIERFYDARFHNKLYAGRRRFITQYVEEFPLPDPHSVIGKALISKAKHIYECIPSPEVETLQEELDCMVWEAFGLIVKEVIG